MRQQGLSMCIKKNPLHRKSWMMRKDIFIPSNMVIIPEEDFRSWLQSSKFT